MKIVIVDDDRAAADALAQRLSTFDETQLCGIALNGMDGLRLVNETRPDVLFLDIELRNIIRRVCIEMAGVPDADCTSAAHQPTDTSSPTADFGNYNALDADNGITCRNDGKFIVYTNSVDFRLVDIREIGVLTYNRELRLWEMTLSNQKAPIRLKRNVGSDALLSLNNQLVRVSQKHIINLGYLMEVTNNTCRFYPPFDKVEDVKVGRLFRKKLIDQFCNL